MNAPSRNPSGTPTGGQFAPGQHAETEVAVADSVHAPPDTAAVDAFGAEGDVISELRQQVEQRQGALSTQAAALVTQQVRARYPSAVQVDFIRFDRDEDNPEETVVFSSVRDDDGEILCAADDGGDLDFQLEWYRAEPWPFRAGRSVCSSVWSFLVGDVVRHDRQWRTAAGPHEVGRRPEVPAPQVARQVVVVLVA